MSEIDIDPGTGLPEVPAGHFWKIKQNANGTRVLLMRRRRFLPATAVGSAWVAVRHPDPSVRVVNTAKYVLRELSIEAQHTEFVGVYPPKQIRGSQ